jgi:hypothetical protein
MPMREGGKECSNLLDQAVTALRRRLPSGWSVLSRSEQARLDRKRSVDAVIEVAGPDGTRAELVVECKFRMLPRDAVSLLARQDSASAGTGNAPTYLFVVSGFLSPRTRELLSRGRAGYADLAGNLRLALEAPAVFIETSAIDRNPAPERRAIKSLRGPAAGRVVRALADFRPPYGIRELARQAQTPPAAVSRVAQLLDREAILTRDERGRIQTVDWVALLRRWATEYSFLRSNQVRSYLEPRSLEALKEKLRNSKASYALTGSAVASVIAPVASPRLTVAFSDEPEQLAGELSLRESETGSNVMLARPFDTVVFDRAFGRDGLRFVSPSQAAADLLTGPGRSPEEAESLIEWMRAHEDAWRS